MAQRNNNQAEYEMQDIPRTSVQKYENRPRTSSFVAATFQGMKMRQENEVAAEKSRRTSRISKGLNPDVPRPVTIPKCKPYPSPRTPQG